MVGISGYKVFAAQQQGRVLNSAGCLQVGPPDSK